MADTAGGPGPNVVAGDYLAAARIGMALYAAWGLVVVLILPWLFGGA